MYAKWIEADGRFAFSGNDDDGDLTIAEHAALFAGQAKGMRIAPDSNGKPMLIEQPAATDGEIIIGQIAALEATVTDRRIREAVLGIDGGWLKDVNDQIAALRAKLK